MFSKTILDTLYADWYQIVLIINFVLGSTLVGTGMTAMIAGHSSKTMSRMAIYMVLTGVVVIIPVIELNAAMDIGIPKSGEPVIWSAISIAKLILVTGFTFQCAAYYKTIIGELNLQPKSKYGQFAK